MFLGVFPLFDSMRSGILMTGSWWVSSGLPPSLTYSTYLPPIMSGLRSFSLSPTKSSKVRLPHY